MTFLSFTSPTMLVHENQLSELGCLYQSKHQATDDLRVPELRMPHSYDNIIIIPNAVTRETG